MTVRTQYEADLTALKAALVEMGQNSADAVEAALSKPTMPGKPKAILAHTVKGKGWKRIEGTTMSHSLSVSADDLAEALNDIDKE